MGGILGNTVRDERMEDIVGASLSGGLSTFLNREVSLIPAKPFPKVIVEEMNFFYEAGCDARVLGQVVEQRSGSTSLSSNNDEVRQRSQMARLEPLLHFLLVRFQ